MRCALVYCLVVGLTISVLVSVALLFHDVELDVGGRAANCLQREGDTDFEPYIDDILNGTPAVDGEICQPHLTCTESASSGCFNDCMTVT